MAKFNANIRKLSSEEAATREFKVTADNIVQATVTTKANKDSPERFNHDVRMDFSTTTHDELLELAAKSIVILAQSRIRKDAATLGMEKAMQQHSDLNVHELVNAERKGRAPVDPVEKAKKAMADLGFTPEQIVAMLEKAPK